MQPGRRQAAGDLLDVELPGLERSHGLRRLRTPSQPEIFQGRNRKGLHLLCHEVAHLQLPALPSLRHGFPHPATR